MPCQSWTLTNKEQKNGQGEAHNLEKNRIISYKTFKRHEAAQLVLAKPKANTTGAAIFEECVSVSHYQLTVSLKPFDEFKSEIEFLVFLGVAESHAKMPGNDNIRAYSCSGHHCKG